MELMTVYFDTDKADGKPRSLRLRDDWQRVSGAHSAGGVHTLKGTRGEKVSVNMDKVTHIEGRRSQS